MCTIAGHPVATTFGTDPSDGCCDGKVLILPSMSGTSFDRIVGVGAPYPSSCRSRPGGPPGPAMNVRIDGAANEPAARRRR